MLLIITSCITPPQQNYLKLSDPDKRLEYTVIGLKKILYHNIFDKVVICDSSSFDFRGTEVESILKENDVTFEFLCFHGDFSKVEEKGKGYGEGQIMQHVIENSRLLKSECYFFKITGRLYVENLNQIVNKIKCNENYFNIVTLKYLKALDSRFYRISVADYKRSLYDACDYVDDKKGKWYETVFRDRLKLHDIKFSQFPVFPIIKGVSGTHGVDLFRKDINYYVHVFFTILNLHNSYISAIIMYVILKISLIFKRI